MYLEYIKFLNSEEAAYTMSRDFWTNCASSNILGGSLVSYPGLMCIALYWHAHSHMHHEPTAAMTHLLLPNEHWNA